MVNKPGLALLDLLGPIHDLLEIFAGRFAFFNLVGRDLELVLLFLELFDLVLNLTLSPTSVGRLYLLPVRVVRVEAG